MRRINHQHIRSRFQQLLCPLQHISRDSQRRADQEPAMLVFGGIGI